MNKQLIGSLTAKGGFLNEKQICKKFDNFRNDKEAQIWLKIMGYDYKKIQVLNAVRIPVRINLAKALKLGVLESKYQETIKFKKADIQVKIEFIIDNVAHIENISLKKANKSAGFNQVDKRSVKTYQKIWKFDDEVAKWLRTFTGDIRPSEIFFRKDLEKLRDQRRLFFTEIPQEKQKRLIDFFSKNKTLVINDIIRGRGGLSAEWLLVTRKNDNSSLDWLLEDINGVCNFYAQGEVKATSRGSLKIGRITMQRKGGTPDPTSLQFKMNPLELFREN